MNKIFSTIVLLFFVQLSFGQKIINNPDWIACNINGSVTKVELTKKETIIHFQVKAPLGAWILIPKETYIEDAFVKGKRLYVVKSEGLNIKERTYFNDSNEKIYKLYFPALSKDVKRINYGEANHGGNWFIYKLDIRKDGTNFIYKEQNISNIEISKPLEIKNNKKAVVYKRAIGFNKSNIKTILPKNLPKEFFGNWYDKHGTLILITTPDYMVSDKRIKYYLDIHKTGNNKYTIQTSSTAIQVLSVDDNTMTVRTNRLITLHKKKGSNKVPEFLKGKWLHWNGLKEIDVTDGYFFNDDKDSKGHHKDIVKNKIDLVAESNNGELIWFVLYNCGDYHIYFVNKKENKYVLQPRGYANAKYYKVND